MNAIVLTFDRLPLSFLACYGNNWIETPNFDRLAAQSVCFHQHFAESLTLNTVRHAWWSGCYECRRQGDPRVSDLLPAALAARGVTVRMLLEAGGQDDKSARDLSQLFPEWTQIVAGADGLDVAPDDTPFLRLVARAQRDLRLLRTSRSEPWLLWIKSRGVPIPWLPPAEYARLFLDVDDDEPTEAAADDDEIDVAETDDDFDEADKYEEPDDGTFLEMSDSQFNDLLRTAAALPPSRALRDKMTDLDRALARKVLGGYIALLDAGVGRLLEAIDQASAGTPTLLLLTAAQGLTVHEPGVLRDDWAQSADEIVHTPLFVRGAGVDRGFRRQTLTQPVDLFPTLFEWFGLERPETLLEGHSLLSAVRDGRADPRQQAFAADQRGLTTVRSADHYLVQQSEPASEEPVRHLFAKPEDAWEVNDLAAQRPQIVDELAAEGDHFFGSASRVVER
jgi:arylsulfatase A-like enzyme